MTKWLNGYVGAMGIALLVPLADGCGGGTGGTRRDGGADGGGPQCLFTEDCPIGFCKDGVCVTCPETPCDSGRVCSAAGRCEACRVNCDAGAPGGDGGGGCGTKFDCPAGQVCQSGACGTPPATCSTHEECPVGKACESSFCVDGCTGDSECAGNAMGTKCNLTTNRCGCASAATDCKTGEVCIAGACQTAQNCTQPSDCGKLACIAGKCQPCTSTTECNRNGTACVNGECVQQGCTQDSQCTTFSPGHWCNTQSGQCEWGCLPAGSCAPSNCCSTGTCDTSTHQCTATGTDGGGGGTDGGFGGIDGGFGGFDGGFGGLCDPNNPTNCGCPSGTQCSTFGFPFCSPIGMCT